MGSLRDRSLMQLYQDLERCNCEIAAIERGEGPEAPAYLVTMGIEDWRREKQAIERELLMYAD